MIDAVNFLRIQLAAKARTERGASAVEYGLLVVLIAIAIIVGATALGGRLNGLFHDSCTSLGTGTGSSC